MRSIASSFRIRTLTALGGILLIVSACSSAGASSAPSAAAPSAAPSAAGGGPEVYTVAVATGSPGSFLTGDDGKTLYTFAKDSPNTTTCVDACAAKWPPFVLETGETVKAGDGVTMALATIARPDGKMQVTYNGMPLYYFAPDTKAGDTNGQGVGGVWFVAAPSGTLGSPGPSTAPSSSAAKGGNY